MAAMMSDLPLMDPTPHHGPASPSWELAACRNEDPELFFPIGTGEASARQTAAAKRVCARCPVRAACRGYALAHPELTGVWGGMSEEERRGHLARRAGRRRAVRSPRPREAVARRDAHAHQHR